MNSTTPLTAAPNRAPNCEAEIAAYCAAKLEREQHDFTFVTDGSGHMDTRGGYAALLKGRGLETTALWGASTGTDTYRMEFTALLEALHVLFVKMGWADKQNQLERLLASPPKIIWYTDNQSLRGQVFRAWEFGGSLVYGRSTHQDLWARFHYYEPMVRITPILLSRDDMRMHVVDYYASTMRSLLVDFANTMPPDKVHQILTV